MKAEDLTLKHDLKIATYIISAIKAGVSMAAILDKVSTMPNGPRAKASLYKIYRTEIAVARADLAEAIGSKVLEMAFAGDTKMLDLAARSKAGWSPTQTIIETDKDDEDENTSAIDDLLALLKIKDDKKVTETEDE